MKLRRAIFWVHLITGCVAGVVIFFLSATGFLLAWQKQAIAWQERGYRAAPPPQALPLPLDRLLGNAAGAEGREPSSVTVRSDLRYPVEVDFGRDRRLFLNRFSGAALGAGAMRTRAFFDEVTTLHRYFGTSSPHHAAAKLVKGAFDLALLLMILTGLYLWLPRVWNWQRVKAGALLRTRLRGRAREWNLHNVLGFWAAIPLTLIVLSGAILAYGWMSRLLYVATGSPLPSSRDEAVAGQHGRHHKLYIADAKPAVPIQQIFDSTARQAAGWQMIRIDLPRRSEPTLEVVVDFLNGSRPDQQTDMTFDRSSGAVIRYAPFSSWSPALQIRSFLKYIHTGEAGGLAGETVAGLASAACCVLVWTGFAMAFRRLRTARAAARSSMPEQGMAEAAAGARPD